MAEIAYGALRTNVIKYTIYSGTPPLQTPLGQGKVSLLERCPHFRGVISIERALWATSNCMSF